jgi:Mg2+/Co2+ transporter CorB
MWRNEPENIVGVLHTKDLVREIARRSGPVDGIDVLSLAAPPWFVPETTTLQEQLAAFRERRTHFALVVDEYGALQGLVTLEDILDEIFGDIPDEHEAREAPGIRRQPDGTFNIDGDVPVREINRALDWNLPEDAATTLAGLVIDEARAIPEVGQRFAFFGFKFEILRRQRNQITAIRVSPPLRAAAPAPEAVRSD